MYHTAYEIFRGMLPLPKIEIAKIMPNCLIDANELVLKRNVPPAQAVPGALGLQKQDGLVEENPERVLEIPRGTVGPSLLPIFSAAKQCHMPISKFFNVTLRA